MEILNTVAVIIALILAGLLFAGIHKMFDIYYFGCQGIAMMFIVCFMVSYWAVAAVVNSGMYIVGKIFMGIWFFIKWGIIGCVGILVALLVIGLVITFLEKIGLINLNSDKDENENSTEICEVEKLEEE